MLDIVLDLSNVQATVVAAPDFDSDKDVQALRGAMKGMGKIQRNMQMSSSVASGGAGGADCPTTMISFPRYRKVKIPKIS